MQRKYVCMWIPRASFPGGTLCQDILIVCSNYFTEGVYMVPLVVISGLQGVVTFTRNIRM